jgi:N-acetyl-gamma-glutamyl-phosphate reductase
MQGRASHAALARQQDSTVSRPREAYVIRVGVMGAAGYAGAELARILLSHPDFELALVTSNADEGERLDAVYPSFVGATDLAFSSHDDPAAYDLDAIFLALPHTASMARVPALLEHGVTVVDLSADFRLRDAATYERWYGVPHACPELLARAAYGLPELFGQGLERLAAERAQGTPALVACPGCYPTASTLASFPLVASGLTTGAVIVDAISGVTGAGKRASTRTHFCSANENLEAYGVGTHRHTPEIEQNLTDAGRGVQQVVFTPHLAPVERAILSTVTMSLSRPATTDELLALYHEAYDHTAFVHVLDGSQPRSASVAGTNNAQLTVVADARTGHAVATCAIDNLCKGAAGQAVQCANVVFGLDERRGLAAIGRAV